MLVIDASVAVALALGHDQPVALTHEELIAPPLLWSETTSAIHELAFRGDIDPDTATAGIASLTSLGIERRDHPRLQIEASRIARQLGWAKTYDAEYVALTLLVGARLLTRDARLQRGASRVIPIIAPADL